MAESRRAETAETEELLEGQSVFKGPRKLRKLLFGSDTEESES